MLDGSQLLACKLFDGPHAGDRARVEGAAYAALAARGAPVPRLLAVEEAHAAVVREWVAGPTLAQALRGDAPPPEWQTVAAAWERLLAALDDWTEALDSERVSRAYHLRQSEIAAVAESVIASAALQHRHPAWEEAGTDIRRLAKTISTAPMRTVPLDLNPGNLILGNDGITFVDLEAFGLDFGEWSLCKATMLPGDPSSGSAGQALAASQRRRSTPEQTLRRRFETPGGRAGTGECAVARARRRRRTVALRSPARGLYDARSRVDDSDFRFPSPCGGSGLDSSTPRWGSTYERKLPTTIT